jgi:hypothetical protein
MRSSLLFDGFLPATGGEDDLVVPNSKVPGWWCWGNVGFHPGLRRLTEFPPESLLQVKWQRAHLRYPSLHTGFGRDRGPGLGEAGGNAPEREERRRSQHGFALLQIIPLATMLASTPNERSLTWQR